MRATGKRAIAVALSCAMVIGMAGCVKKVKKAPKPEPKATTVVDDGNTNAKGKGGGQSDTPLVIGCQKLSKNFNPFSVKTEDDKRVVDLTQANLVINDRAGEFIYNGIDGEVRQYNGKDYTYYGMADIDVKYRPKKDRTVYTITLRDDLLFSDGEPVTIDDVIFTLYAYCDNDYNGSVTFKNSNIVGLLNYQVNNDIAEKISDKKVKKYISENKSELDKQIKKEIKSGDISKSDKKNYYKALEREARKQIALSEKKGSKVKKIRGIKKIDNYKLRIVTYGHNKDLLYSLKIPVCPLHYYGDVSKYDYEKGKFGFKRGDISTLCANKTSPVGAGPYRFVKYEKGIVYYTSNELYYNGCPKIAFVQYKEMSAILKNTRKNIPEETQGPTEDTGNGIDTEETTGPAEDAGTGKDTEETPEPTPIPEDAVNHVPEVTEIVEGTVDVMETTLDSEALRWVAAANSNGKISGSTISTRFNSDQKYEYVGINSDKVNVAGKTDDKKSKMLRRALATVINVNKEKALEYYGDAANLIEYPYPSESWLYPDESDEEYKKAFTTDINGEEIYDEDTEYEDRVEAVKKASLEYLQSAGYEVEGDKVIKAPEGASLKYSILVRGGTSNPIYKVIESSANMLEEMGIKLKIVSVDSEAKFNRIIKSGKYQLWCGTCDTSFLGGVNGYDINHRYGIKDNLFGINDSLVSRITFKARCAIKDEGKKKLYRKSFDLIDDWAVEIPVFEAQTATLYSAKRISMSDMTKNTSAYYSWLDEIQNITMK